MHVKLIMVSGSASSTEIDVQPPVILGRGRKAGITLPHTLVSRQHCEIYEQDGQLMIRDLGSLNGTLVNRRPIDQPTPLHHGDSLFIGALMFRVEFFDACATKRDAADETAIATGPFTPASDSANPHSTVIDARPASAPAPPHAASPETEVASKDPQTDPPTTRANPSEDEIVLPEDEVVSPEEPGRNDPLGAP